MSKFVQNYRRAIGLAIVGLLVCGIAQAAVLTGTVNRLIAEGAGWSLQYDDQSDYPNQSHRHGTIVRYYNFALDGGAEGTISLEKGTVVTAIPDNTIVVGGYVDTLTPLTPAATTNMIGLNGTNDVVAYGTSFTSAGVTALAITGAGGAVKATNALPLNFIIDDGAVTAGVFMVVLDVYYGN